MLDDSGNMMFRGTRTPAGETESMQFRRSRRAARASFAARLQSPNEGLHHREVDEPENSSSVTGKARQCPLCPRAFSKHEHLARHLRSHTKEKPFECSICDKRFGRNDTLLRHVRSHPPSQQNKPTQSNINVLAADELQSNLQGTEEPQAPSSSVILQRASSIGNEHQPADPYDNLVVGGENVSDTSCRNMHTPDQIVSPVGGLNRTISHGPGHLQHRLYTPVSLNSDPAQTLWETVAVDSEPSLGHPSDLMDASSTRLDFPDMQFNNSSPTWFVGDDFDLNAFNSTIQESIVQYIYPRQPHLSDFRIQSPLTYDSNTQEEPPNSSTILPPLSFDHVTKNWFSNIEVRSENPVTHPGSPGPGLDHIDVDEAYRVELSSKLQVPPCHESLPSTEFLNLCIRAYFTRFNPIFPLLHGPTFQPSAKNSLLLLSICSVGSLFIGSADAIKQGTSIFERLNKAILASWEHHLARGGGEGLSMIQAAVIGQTFGMLSGNPWHLTMVDAFHGTVVAWARRSKMFLHRQAKLPSQISSRQEVNQTWKQWVYTEEVVRILVGLYIHDSELASIFHHDPILRHNIAKIPISSSSALFMATNADQWFATCQKERSHMEGRTFNQRGGLDEQQSLLTSITMPGSFTAYVYLASIAARIREIRNLGELDEHTRAQHESSLVHWYQEFKVRSDKTDVLCLMILWHSTFMSLFADLDMLERAVGRDGSAVLDDGSWGLNHWVSSLDAQRCIIHGLLVLKRVNEMQMGFEPAIHVPRTLFLAGITLFCYTYYRQVSPETTIFESQDELLSLPEIRLLDTSSVMYIFKAERNRSGKLSVVEAAALCNITDLLQRIGHWEIARKYGSTLELIIQEGNADTKAMGI